MAAPDAAPLPVTVPLADLLSEDEAAVDAALEGITACPGNPCSACINLRLDSLTSSWIFVHIVLLNSRMWPNHLTCMPKQYALKLNLITAKTFQHGFASRVTL